MYGIVPAPPVLGREYRTSSSTENATLYCPSFALLSVSGCAAVPAVSFDESEVYTSFSSVSTSPVTSSRIW